MEVGDMIYPKKLTQSPLPFMELHPGVIIAKEYAEPDENDCQSEINEFDAIRWIILSEGEVYAYSHWIIESFYEIR